MRIIRQWIVLSLLSLLFFLSCSKSKSPTEPPPLPPPPPETLEQKLMLSPRPNQEAEEAGLYWHITHDTAKDMRLVVSSEKYDALLVHLARYREQCRWYNDSIPSWSNGHLRAGYGYIDSSKFRLPFAEPVQIRVQLTCSGCEFHGWDSLNTYYGKDSIVDHHIDDFYTLYFSKVLFAPYVKEAYVGLDGIYQAYYLPCSGPLIVCGHDDGLHLYLWLFSGYNEFYWEYYTVIYFAEDKNGNYRLVGHWAAKTSVAIPDTLPWGDTAMVEKHVYDSIGRL